MTVAMLTSLVVGEVDAARGVRPLGKDPVLAALDAAPFMPVTDEEVATLDAIERDNARWIPHCELVAGLANGPEASRDL